MRERATNYFCLLAGFLSANVAWPLVVSAPVTWTAGVMLLIGLLTVILVRKAPPKRGKALLNLWAGVLFGGLVQLGYQVLRYPTGSEGFVFYLVLTLVVVTFVAAITSAGYLLGSVFVRRKEKDGT